MTSGSRVTRLRGEAASVSLKVVWITASGMDKVSWPEEEVNAASRSRARENRIVMRVNCDRKATTTAQEEQGLEGLQEGMFSTAVSMERTSRFTSAALPVNRGVRWCSDVGVMWSRSWSWHRVHPPAWWARKARGWAS